MLSPPVLTRCRAASLAVDPLSPEAEKLIDTVKLAYANMPFKGAPLVLPGGIVAVADMWQASLEDRLLSLSEGGLAKLRDFSLETWLVAKVEAEGTETQKEQFRELQKRLDARDVAHPADDDLRSFYQSDLMSDHFQDQPLMEVEVYRDLNLADVHVESESPDSSGPSPNFGDDDDDSESGRNHDDIPSFPRQGP